MKLKELKQIKSKGGDKKIMKTKIKQEKGITLIALVVTIVVLLILAGVSINAIFNDNGIIKRAQEAQNKMNEAQQKDLNSMNELNNWLENQVSKKTTGGNTIPTEPETTTGPTVTINGSTVTLTKSNVYQYLGKKVTNYTGKSKVTIGSTEYTVSPTYRLYYVDFDNKYKDKSGTIYLKAECTSNVYYLPATDRSSNTDTNIKIKALNPSLYVSEVAAPTASNENMRVVTWLTNTTNWASLADTTMSSNINYIVGSPSLEMMMDSYNTHYQLTGDTPYTSAITAGTRKKLFYKYTSGAYGYKVGPSNHSDAESGYNAYTSDNSVYTDSEIDSMYYPGSSQCYWLSSPCDRASDDILAVYYNSGGGMGANYYEGRNAFCPVVSLKPSVQLQLQ